MKLQMHGDVLPGLLCKKIVTVGYRKHIFITILHLQSCLNYEPLGSLWFGLDEGMSIYTFYAML